MRHTTNSRIQEALAIGALLSLIVGLVLHAVATDQLAEAFGTLAFFLTALSVAVPGK